VSRERATAGPDHVEYLPKSIRSQAISVPIYNKGGAIQADIEQAQADLARRESINEDLRSSRLPSHRMVGSPRIPTRA